MPNPPEFIGPWKVDAQSYTLTRGTDERRLEPKTMELLLYLATKPGIVCTHDELLEAIWPGTFASQESLARCISKLRKALDDSPKDPQYLETLPKRGYRLITQAVAYSSKPDAEALVHPIVEKQTLLNRRFITVAGLLAAIMVVIAAGYSVLVSLGFPDPDSQSQHTGQTGNDRVLSNTPQMSYSETLNQQAHDFYCQFTRADNEAAMALYERGITHDLHFAANYWGLANTLIQKTLRWSEPPGKQPIHHTGLAQALDDGRFSSDEARANIGRAQELALRAVQMAPDDPKAHRSLGLTYAVQRKLVQARAEYESAIVLDPDAWGSLIDLGDLLQAENQHGEALAVFEQAYQAMERVYDQEPVCVRPWLPGLAVVIGNEYRKQGKLGDAEIWYRHVLSYSPYHADATDALADLLAVCGNQKEAESLRQSLYERTGQ